MTTDYRLGRLQEMFVQFEPLRPGAFLGPTFLLRAAFKLYGHVDFDRLREAVAAVVVRHAALRTSITRDGDGVAWQRLHEAVEPRVDRVRLAPSAIDDDHLLAALREATGSGIDVTSSSLLHVVLFEQGANSSVLLILAHHMISDAASMLVISRNIAAAYRDPAGYAAQPPGPIYGEIAERLHTGRADEVAANVAFWARTLGGLTAIHLPHDRPRSFPDMPDQRATVLFALPSEVMSMVSDLGRQERASRFFVLLSAFALLIRVESGAVDVAVPTNFSGRVSPDSEVAVGPFVSGLVLRVDLSGEPSFREVVRRVRTAMLEAYEHLNVPLSEVLMAAPELLALIADPEFVWTYFQMIPMAAGSDFELEAVASETFDYLMLREAVAAAPLTEDLVVTLFERGGEVVGAARYRRMLFDPPTVERLMARYVEILDAGLRHPDAPLTG